MNQVVIAELLGIAQKHRKQLGHMKMILSPTMPLTSATVETFTTDDIAAWDAFIMRFCMLQDLMGTKLFSAFLTLAGQEASTMTIIDMIHSLEKMGVIENSELWRDIRETRNKLTHEYPNMPILSAELLNKAFFQIDTLFQILDAIGERNKTLNW